MSHDFAAWCFELLDADSELEAVATKSQNTAWFDGFSRRCHKITENGHTICLHSWQACISVAECSTIVARSFC